MKFFNHAVSLMDHPEFMTATMEQVGVWWFLSGHCHEQENYGTIADCKSWPDRFWAKLGLPSAAVVLASSPLWHWQGQSLVVHHYNREAQTAHGAMVKQRKAAIAARWNKHKNNGQNGAH